MIGEAEKVLRELDERDPVRIRRAIFVEATSTGSAWVDMANSRFSCDFGAGYIPRAGETVFVLSMGERHLMFPARPLPGTGVVVTVAAGIARVQTSIGEFAMPYIGAAPSSGNIVGISWSEQPFVIGALSIQPAAPQPIPDPGAGQVRSATFRAIDTGSTDRGAVRWWQSQPWASNSTYGAWFYGTQIRDTIPAGAQFVSLEFFASWQQRQGDAPRFALHNGAAKTGIPSFGGYTAWTPGNDWQTPPMAAAWFAGLKAGGGMLGVGLNQGGFNKFSNLVQNSMSGALRISWRS